MAAWKQQLYEKTQIGEFWSVQSVGISPVVCILGDLAIEAAALRENTDW
jgi:hypothetical protein